MRPNKNQQEDTIPDALLSRRQAAAIVAVSTETIKRRERDGLLKAIRFNSRLVRYRRADVERMINEAS
jgi:predicted site-specific integrase-resolvase